MRKANEIRRDELQSMYQNLWGHWCPIHQCDMTYFLEGSSRWRWRCLSCQSAAAHKNRAERRKDPAFRKAEKARYRKWLAKRIAENPDAAAKYRAIRKRWQYKRRERLAASPLSTEDLLLFDQTYSYCLRCGSTDDLTIDHIVPLAKGGGSEFLNLQCLCRLCNSSKQTDIVDYRVRIPIALQPITGEGNIPAPELAHYQSKLR